jgi:hypothetical protein
MASNTIVIQLEEQDSENYIAECRKGLTRTLKSRAKLPITELNDEDQTASWFLLDLLERLDSATAQMKTT